jgi:hypothetical protein
MESVIQRLDQHNQSLQYQQESLQQAHSKIVIFHQRNRLEISPSTSGKERNPLANFRA